MSYFVNSFNFHFSSSTGNDQIDREIDEETEREKENTSSSKEEEDKTTHAQSYRFICNYFNE